jgi:hypothetical protein
MTFDEAIGRVAKRTFQNKENIDQKDRQRRYSFVDMYGIEYTRQGDGGSPATFYIGIPKDMEYMLRYEFKLIVQPFVSTVASEGIQSAVVDVNPTSLSVSGSSVNPNPHDHSTQPHTHSVVAGVSMTHTTANDFLIKIDDIDVTPYLMAQGDWIDGEGIFPSAEIGDDFDILEVASDLKAEGRTEDAHKLVCAGNHKVEISSGSPFQVTLVNYLKYSHMNR